MAGAKSATCDPHGVKEGLVEDRIPPLNAPVASRRRELRREEVSQHERRGGRNERTHLRMPFRSTILLLTFIERPNRNDRTTSEAEKEEREQSDSFSFTHAHGRSGLEGS